MQQAFQIDYLELPSTDGVKTHRFFEEAFGWRTVSYGAQYHGIEAAGIETGINSDPEDRTAAPMPVVRCSDLVAAETAVLAAGGTMVRAAYDFPGGRRFHFREPGGVELAVYVASES